ncbi:hypothetical protein NP493_662g01133 [Ridgeia piscesae]|uniref:PiggyBac transposable element-derived protein domain-containing protein n=1 Tax=Ridgeia piscesae TaxID=27915 RepID=A0AAD9KS37_RIDPI|nr:hypothetical protein NP493_662g01133 [Ridgeia piscesae]
MDTKPVPTLTNFHKPAQEGTVLRRREQVHAQVPVPKVLEDYQQHMRGVDLMDRVISYHTLNHHSKKWWPRVFLRHDGVCSQRVCCGEGPAYHQHQWPTFFDFLEDLASDLVGDTRTDRAQR